MYLARRRECLGMAANRRSAFAQISETAGSHAVSDLDSFSFPADIITKLEENGIEPDEIDRIIGPREELTRLVDQHAQLTADQTDRAARLARVVLLAECVFGNDKQAFMWLRLPNPELDGRRPLECLVREPAARAVEEALNRIDYGIAG
jgi:putative toxin-antitoxin system antitoxin component (TIGR02293 family)